MQRQPDQRLDAAVPGRASWRATRTGSLRRVALALGLAGMVSACVLSIESVIPESGATFDPRLIGTWETEPDSDRAVIARAAGNAYAIEYTSGKEVTHFGARLGRLNGRLVLDVWPAPAEHDVPEMYSGLVILGHVLFTLDVAADVVRTSMLDPDAFRQALRTRDVPLESGGSGDQVILQGTSDRVRAALGSYLARATGLTEPEVWHRARATAAPLGPVDVPCLAAAAWPDADRLFHRDPHWLGADAASTVDLGGGRTLWLFGDSWIDPSGTGSRRNATLISNTVAIQTGADPSRASIAFHWRRDSAGAPVPIVPDSAGERHWFGNGVRIGDRLVLFFNRIVSTTAGLGFASAGWGAVMVENPDDDPSAWRTTPVATPTNPLGILVGFAGVRRLGDYVYAFGSQDPVKSHPIYAARWTADDVGRGRLLEPEWWAGERIGWVPDSSGTPRWPIFENGQSEISISFDQATGRWLAVQSQGFGPADVTVRAAPALTGPWSATRSVYRPPEYYRPNVMIYAAKAHPELSGADVVLTYATNTTVFAEHLTDNEIYYPHFVQLTRCSTSGR